jgi:hypothetical protein
MTTPAQPDTGAGAAPDTGSAPAEDATTETQPQTETTDTDAPDPAAEIAKWKSQARKHEERAKANKKALDELKAAQQGETGEDWQAKATEAEQRAADAEERAVELAYSSTVTRIAAKAQLDAEALLDSGRFREAVAEELGDEEFDDDDLRAAVEKIAKSKEFSGNPRFTGQRTPARSGSDMPGGPAGLRQITEAELQRMTPEQIVEAQNKGQLNSLLGAT